MYIYLKYCKNKYTNS